MSKLRVQLRIIRMPPWGFQTHGPADGLARAMTVSIGLNSFPFELTHYHQSSLRIGRRGNQTTPESACQGDPLPLWDRHVLSSLTRRGGGTLGKDKPGCNRCPDVHLPRRQSWELGRLDGMEGTNISARKPYRGACRIGNANRSEKAASR